MAEEFIVLMADLDEESQAKMSGWYKELENAGFKGVQTPGLPFHISMNVFPLEKEQEAVELVKKIGSEFSEVPVHLSHMGMFAGGKVLFAGPEREPALNALHDACESTDPQPYPWTPHVTIFIDEPETVQAALPLVVKSFEPFVAKISRLHLCAFWPTREIISVDLKSNGETD